MAAKKKARQNSENLVVAAVLLLVVVGCSIAAGSSSDDNVPDAVESAPGVSEETTTDPRREIIKGWQDSYQGKTPMAVPYAELFRNSEKYLSKFIKLKGEVIQVLGDPGEWNLRVNVTDKSSYGVSLWEDTIFVTSYSDKRVIEGDIIEFVGRGEGTQTYESTFGGEITIPAVTTLDTLVVGRTD